MPLSRGSYPVAGGLMFFRADRCGAADTQSPVSYRSQASPFYERSGYGRITGLNRILGHGEHAVLPALLQAT